MEDEALAVKQVVAAAGELNDCHFFLVAPLHFEIFEADSAFVLVRVASVGVEVLLFDYDLSGELVLVRVPNLAVESKINTDQHKNNVREVSSKYVE